jgi:hypothetical protein
MANFVLTRENIASLVAILLKIQLVGIEELRVKIKELCDRADIVIGQVALISLPTTRGRIWSPQDELSLTHSLPWQAEELNQRQVDPDKFITDEIASCVTCFNDRLEAYLGTARLAVSTGEEDLLGDEFVRELRELRLRLEAAFKGLEIAGLR